VIMISAMPDKDLESQALKHGAIAFLPKPFFNVDVSRAVHKALDLKMPNLTANWAPEREVKRNAVCPADDDQDTRAGDNSRAVTWV